MPGGGRARRTPLSCRSNQAFDLVVTAMNDRQFVYDTHWKENACIVIWVGGKKLDDVRARVRCMRLHGPHQQLEDNGAQRGPPPRPRDGRELVEQPSSALSGRRQASSCFMAADVRDFWC